MVLSVWTHLLQTLAVISINLLGHSAVDLSLSLHAQLCYAPCFSHPPVALCHSCRAVRLPAFLCYPSSMEPWIPISSDGLPVASSHSIQSFKLSVRWQAERSWLTSLRHFSKEGLLAIEGQWQGCVGLEEIPPAF